LFFTRNPSDPWARADGTGTPLYSMMAVVLRNGWESHTHQSNEAYILLNLGQRMHVKVVTVVGKGDGTFNTALNPHFIALYDQTSLDLSTEPAVFLSGNGNGNKYDEGWDHKINAWGKYVALWNSINHNYIVCSYIAIFATEHDCYDITSWMSIPSPNPTLTVLYTNTVKIFNLYDLFPKIPATCKDVYIKNVGDSIDPSITWIAYARANPKPNFTLSVTP
jgi:hypothetical protein